eukprot:162921_1
MLNREFIRMSQFISDTNVCKQYQQYVYIIDQFMIIPRIMLCNMNIKQFGASFQCPCITSKPNEVSTKFIISWIMNTTFKCRSIYIKICDSNPTEMSADAVINSLLDFRAKNISLSQWEWPSYLNTTEVALVGNIVSDGISQMWKYKPKWFECFEKLQLKTQTKLIIINNNLRYGATTNNDANVDIDMGE